MSAIMLQSSPFLPVLLQLCRQLCMYIGRVPTATIFLEDACCVCTRRSLHAVQAVSLPSRSKALSVFVLFLLEGEGYKGGSSTTV